VSSLRNTDEFAENPKDPKEIDVLCVELSTVYASEWVQIPAARFSETWENFFALKRFAKIAELGRVGSSQWGLTEA
jgi:hypothetical protein